MRPFQKLAREEALGRYRLIARLGQGGMADVFLARLVGAGGFEKLVAVKRMLPSLASDRRFVSMFLNEGRIAAQLDHPNVCHVYEFDEAEGTLFLAMEFLRGLPWSEVVPAIPDRPRTTLVRFVAGAIAQACEGLHHAHTAVGVDGQPRSIVHRDVSPTNLFVTNEGVVKLLDFGVSKMLTESGMTASGALKGKLPYMSPEQLRNMPVDARADIFSLAVMTWEALAGRALFDRASDYETMMAVAEAEIPALPGDDPVTERLDEVLRCGLARDRTHRHGSARGFADDLRGAIAAYGAPMMAIEIQAQVSTWLGPSLLRRSRELAALLGGWRQLEEMTDEQTRVHEPAPVAGVRLRDVSVAVGSSELAAVRAIEGMPAASSADTVTDLTPASVTDALGVAMSATSGELTIPGVASPRVAAPLGMAGFADTVTDRMPAATVGTPGVAMSAMSARSALSASSAEQTRPRVASPRVAAPLDLAGFTDTLADRRPAATVGTPDVALIATSGELTRPRVANPRQAASHGRPAWVPTVALPKPLPRSQRASLALLVIAIIVMAAGVIVGLWLS